jgi:polyketide synthase 3/4
MACRLPGGIDSVHPLLGAHVHLHEEPERHVWQGDVGTEAHPWLGDHQLHGVAALPGAAFCEMALAAARTTLGDESEVRDIMFETTLLLVDETVASSTATAGEPGVFEFVVNTHDDGLDSDQGLRRAGAVLHAVQDLQAPAAHDMDTPIANHPTRVDGAELRKGFDTVGIQYGPAFAGLAAALIAEGTDGAITTVLAEVALPPTIRSQQADSGHWRNVV